MSTKASALNTKKAGKRRWRFASGTTKRAEPRFETDQPEGLYLRLDGEGRIVACHPDLGGMLPAGWPADAVLLSALQLSPSTCLDGSPENWPTDLPLLKVAMASGGEGHFAATLMRQEGGWLLHLVDVSGLVQRVADQDRLLRVIRQTGAIGEQLRHGKAGAAVLVTDWLESLSMQMALPGLAIMIKRAGTWQRVHDFQPPGAPPATVVPAQVLLALESRQLAPVRWRSNEDEPFWLVPYWQEGRVVAWLCCAGTPDVSSPWCGPEDWLQLFAHVAAPLLSHQKAEEFQREKTRYHALDHMLGGGWWEYWPDNKRVRLGANLALALGRDELAGDTLSYGDWLRQIDPLDRDEFRVKLSRIGESQPLRHRVRFDIAGKQCWYSIEAARVAYADGPCVIGFAINSDRAQAQEDRAQAAMARLQGFIDSAPGIIYVQNYDDGALQTSFCSASVEQILGFSGDEFCSRAFSSFVHPDDVEIYFEHVRKLLREGHSSAQYRVFGKTGSVCWLQDEATALRDDHGVPVEVVGLCLDSTEINEARQQLLHSAKMATLGQMATALAHEINQPLNVMHMTLTNLRGRVAAGNTPESYIDSKLERIAGQLTRTAKIVDHMRVFGRQSDLQGRLFAPDAAIKGAASLLEQQLMLDGISLTISIGDLPTVCGHVERLEQVLINLLINASYAIRQRRESDDTVEPRIEIEAHTNTNNNVVIYVRDSGGGVGDADLERLFEPFFTTKPTGEGTGLGLSVSYAIIKQMGGVLSARNAGAGAEFAITLPAHDDLNKAC